MRGEKPQEGYPVFNQYLDLGDLAEAEKEGFSGDSFEPYAWTIMNIFTKEEELVEGIWKLPLYKCPTELFTNQYNFPIGRVRFGDPGIWMRIAYPDDQTDFDCNPGLEHIYKVP